MTKKELFEFLKDVPDDYRIEITRIVTILSQFHHTFPIQKIFIHHENNSIIFSSYDDVNIKPNEVVFQALA